MSRPLKPLPLFLIFLFDLLITLVYGYELLGKPARAVNMLMLVALGMTVGVALTKFFVAAKKGKEVNS